MIPIKDAKSLAEFLSAELKNEYEAEEIRFLSWVLMEEYASISTADLLVNRHLTRTSVQLEQLEQAVLRLKKHEPWQYIVGHCPFMDLDLLVTPDVLIPRPETEELATKICARTLSGNLLDIGTGSGCLALALKQRHPQLNVSAIDVSANALSIAKQNAVRNQLQIQLIEWDVFTPPPVFPLFQTIISNPPYVLHSDAVEMNKNVLHYEPHQALFVVDNHPLVYYLRILELTHSILEPGGQLFFEIHEKMGFKLMDVMEENGFETSLEKDYKGRDRFILATKLNA